MSALIRAETDPLLAKLGTENVIHLQILGFLHSYIPVTFLSTPRLCFSSSNVFLSDNFIEEEMSVRQSEPSVLVFSMFEC